MVKTYITKQDILNRISEGSDNTKYTIKEINCSSEYYYLIFLMVEYIKSHYRNQKDIPNVNIFDIYDSSKGINIDYVGGDTFISNLIKYTIEFSINVKK